MTDDQLELPGTLPTASTRTFPGFSIPLFQREDGTTEGVLLGLSVCPNEDCPCTTMTLVGYAFRQAPGQEAERKAQTFRLEHDVATGKTTGFERGLSAEEAGIVDGLRKVLRRKSIKQAFEGVFREQRAALEPKADPSYDFTQNHDGTMAHYAEVFPDAAAPTMVIDGVTYLFEDAWCVNPSCSCEEGFITVYVDETPATQGELPPLVRVGAVRVPDGSNPGPGPALSTELRRAALSPVLGRTIALHRKRMRAEAARRWGVVRRKQAPPRIAPPAPMLAAPEGPMAARAKVGRNERCPCGSGKKFKHCCLRAG